MKQARRIIATVMVLCMLLSIGGISALAEGFDVPYAKYVGEVLGDGGEIIPKVTVTVKDAAGQMVKTQTMMGEGENATIVEENLEAITGDGTYWFSLPAGNYTFIFNAKEYRETTVYCELPFNHDFQYDIFVPLARMSLRDGADQPQMAESGATQAPAGSGNVSSGQPTPEIAPEPPPSDFSFTKKEETPTSDGVQTGADQPPTIVVPKVENVKAELTEADSYHISWSGVESADHYVLTLRDASDLNGTTSDVLSREVPAGTTTFTVPTSELVLNTKYLVTVYTVEVHDETPIRSTDAGTTIFTFGEELAGPPANPATPGDPATPTDTTDTTSPTDATDTTDTTNPTDPTDATDTTDPTDTTDATEPTDATTSTDATVPTDANAPTDSTESTGETQEAAPVIMFATAMSLPGVTISGVDNASGDSATNVTIRWEASGTPLPASYALEVTGGAAGTYTQTGLTGTSHAMPRSVGNYTAKVTATYSDGTTTPVVSDPYEFSVLQTYSGPTKGWANKATVAVYDNPRSGATKVTDLTQNQEATIVGQTGDNAYYQISYTGVTGAKYGFVAAADISLLNPAKLEAPTNLVATVNEANAFAVISWTGNDTRAKQYEVKIFQESTPAVVDTILVTYPTATYTYTGSIKYNTKYVVEVRAITDVTGIESSAEIVSSFTRTTPSGAIGAPVLQGDILSGFIVRGSSAVTWAAVSGAKAYEWVIYDSNGVARGGETSTTTSLPASKFQSLAVHGNFTLAIRSLPTSVTSNPSVWTYAKFYMVETTDTFIRDFTMTPATGIVAPYTSVKFTLNATTMPTTAKLMIRNVDTGIVTTTPDLAVTSGTVTHSFTTSGKYEVYFFNGTGIPTSASKSLTVSAVSIVIYNTDYFSPKAKGTAFQVEWNYISDAKYEIQTHYYDGTLQQKLTVSSYPPTIPGTSIGQIGRYWLVITGSLDGATTEAELAFDVVDGSYKEWTGTVKANGTNTYMTAGTQVPNMAYILSKDTKVTVIGELGDYYHINIGGIGTSANRLFVAKSALSGTNSNSSSSGSGSGGSGSSSGGSGGSGGTGAGGSGGRAGTAGGSISTTAYRDAFGSAALRESSYTYIEDLYEPLTKAVEEGETMRRSKLDLLTTSFAQLPSELLSPQYAEVRTRAAWNLVTAYMTYLARLEATPEVLAGDDAQGKILTALGATIDEVLASDKQMDEEIIKVLEQLRTSINTLSQQSGGSLGTTKQEAVDTLIKRMFDTMPYDEKILEPVHKAFELDKDNQPVPEDELMEIQMLRVLYALTEYEQNRLTEALTALSATATISDVNVVQAAYLDYVFAVAKLHQLAFAFGGAAADTVVQNWGAEIARLIAVNKVYNTYAQ